MTLLLFQLISHSPILWAYRKASSCMQEDNTNRINTQENIHISSLIRAHDPGIRADEDSSRFRPRSHCDLQEFFRLINLNFKQSEGSLKWLL
jgi:hypothetical protein